ncbi:MAG TPA: hypothetical protein VG943_12830 [Caulobacterales bacterium]|nr:hypothetical protein [Caulobacterales bacterium]
MIMQGEHTINALSRKRGELVGKITHLQDSLRALVIDLDHIDATLRIIHPEIDLEPIKVRPVPPVHRAFQGEISEIALDMLREAGSPLTSAEIAERVMQERGLDLRNAVLRRTMVKRIGAALGKWRREGIIKEAGERRVKTGEGSFKAWVLKNE